MDSKEEPKDDPIKKPEEESKTFKPKDNKKEPSYEQRVIEEF